MYLSTWPYLALPSFKLAVLQSSSSIIHLGGGICQLWVASSSWCQFDRHLRFEEGSFPNIDYNELSEPVGLDRKSDGDATVKEKMSAGVWIPTNILPHVDWWAKGFGLSYTDAQLIETKLLKMLNDIQAPKYMYSSMLKWAQIQLYSSSGNKRFPCE